MTRRRLGLLAVLALFTLVAAACGGGGSSDAGGDATPSDTGAQTEASDADGEGSEAAEGEGDGPKVGIVYDIGGRGDQSFNDAAAAGLDRAAEEFGLETQDLEPNAGGENREELLRLLAQDGYELIFGVGFLFGDSITAVAEEFGDTTFAIVDSVVEADNVASLTFAEEQGSFLVGAAAALTSQSGTIGFIGGVETDLITKFEAGYVAGAEHVNPDIEVEIGYLTQPPDFSGFNDPARGKEVALGQYGAGADVIYHAAGGSGSGLFDAAQETSDGGEKVWAIGVDSDQINLVDESQKEFILTSMIKRVDVVVYDTIATFVEDGSVSGVQVFDLESGGVDYSTTGGHVDEISDQLDELKQQIIDGEIEVPTAP